ncbi:cuticle protein 19-like [Diorhabda carinulata]|uniref:cuticle protein 19-like n=1 Tax=Diorhabda carinulata TaxID=1163345 RepID=UPI0025A24870|nr:cuticle protein 19-like [Diorhabda carinulata]
MVSKIIVLAFLVASTQAIRYENNGATSSIVFNNNHNSIQHIPSAFAAPSNGYSNSYSSHAAPAIQAAPIAHYVSPAVKVAKPVAFKSASPSYTANSYSNLNFAGNGAQLHYTAPSAKVVAPVFIKTAPAVAPVSYEQAAPSYNQGSYKAYHQEEENTYPKYEFAYGVEDHHTGDIHSHKEVRDGDVTQGEYSLHEADGTIRTVKYTVDKHSGFNAVVERTGQPHAQPAKTIAAASAPYYHY